MKKSFILFVDSLGILEEMTDEQAGKFIKIIYQYQKTGSSDCDDFDTKMAVFSLIQQFKRDDEKYQNICNRNRVNGLKGGRPKNPKNPMGNLETQKNPEEPKKADTDTDTDTGTENEIIKYSFDLFWNLYDKKVGKKSKISKKWDNLSIEVQSKILEHIPKYLLSQPNKKFRKNVETYLNNEGWKDEIIIEKKSKIKSSAYQEEGYKF